MNYSEKHLHILIIDDELDMCWALRRIVESYGHTCAIAECARKALQILEAEPFQLAFVNVKLPDMEGLELVPRLHSRSPRLPCIVVSGYFYDDDEPVQTALQSGAISAFISKPFRLDEVHQAIQNATHSV